MPIPTRRPRYRPVLSALAPLTLAALSATASSAVQDLGDEIDEVLRWATASTPGCVVAVAQDGEIVLSRAYGLADLENEVAMTQGTVFDVGSLVKQFVAAAVLLLVEDGHLSLDDDVREHLPELPEYDHVITVDHLLTHTSGVRDWIGLQGMAAEPEGAMALIVRQRGLNFAPGEEWSYSNSGYVLLKELVARLAKESFSEFARSRLFQPLGMGATHYAEDPSVAPDRLAIGYERAGNGWKKDVLAGNERGGGALFSTVDDLMTWNDALDLERLGSFVTEKLQEPVRLNNGRELGYGRGLFLEQGEGRQVIWHSGSAGGYKAMLSRYPEHGVSIAVLSNAGEASNRAAVVRRICDRLLPDTDSATGADPRPGAGDRSVSGIDVESKAGTYFSERTGQALRITARGGHLQVEGSRPLLPVGEGRFRNPQPSLPLLSGDHFELHFRSDDHFELHSMEGEITRYRRGDPGTPTVAELQALAGRYESEELRATLEVGVESDALLVVRLGSRAVHFEAVDRDVFQLRRMLLRFRREPSGRVTAVALTNPLLREVDFARTTDAAETDSAADDGSPPGAG